MPLLKNKTASDFTTLKKEVANNELFISDEKDKNRANVKHRRTLVSYPPTYTPSFVTNNISRSVGYIPYALSRILQAVAIPRIFAFAGDPDISTYSGDNGPALSAGFTSVRALGIDGTGNIFILDNNSYVVRKVDTNGRLTRFAGTGAQGETGNGGPATSATFFNLLSMTCDIEGNVYVYDSAARTIRKVNTSGIINTIAGLGKFGGTTPAAAYNEAALGKAILGSPTYLKIGHNGNLYFSDITNDTVSKIDSSGNYQLVAGTGTQGFSGDGGAATSCTLNNPSGLAFDRMGNTYIADTSNNRIRKIDSTGTITTFAGTGVQGIDGDGGPAISCKFNAPGDIACDSRGNLYIVDGTSTLRIRKIDSSGIINTVVGIHGVTSANRTTVVNGGVATSSVLGSQIYSLLFDASDNLYFADNICGQVRKLNFFEYINATP